MQIDSTQKTHSWTSLIFESLKLIQRKVDFFFNKRKDLLLKSQQLV